MLNEHPAHPPALLGAALLAAVPVHAEGWTHEIAPYVWGAGMDGTAGVRDVTADVNQSFGDIVDNLEIGFMGLYRGTRDRYSVTVDTVYMGLGVVERGPGGLLKADIDMDQLAVELDGGYEVLDRFVVFGGLRYIDMQARVKTTGALGAIRQAKGSEKLDRSRHRRALHHSVQRPVVREPARRRRRLWHRVGYRMAGYCDVALAGDSDPRRVSGLPLHDHGLRQRIGRRLLQVRHGDVGPGARRRIHVLKHARQ